MDYGLFLTSSPKPDLVTNSRRVLYMQLFLALVQLAIPFIRQDYI
jgi:hypothetical protein